MILISHEVPQCLLEKSLQFNDYNYCLVHLCETHPIYKEFYKKSRVNGLDLLLDNSIFELGKAFDPAKFANYIQELQPSYYVIPDSLENKDETIQSYKNFVRDYDNLNGAKIGVVQGKTFNELVECYKFMSDNADYIALSFDLSFYQYIGTGNTKLERQCSGRIRFIETLYHECIINHDKPHHLLGCSLAKEFRYYTKNGFSFIRSCDTSNPVVSGMLGITYSGEFGLQTKPSIKLADMIDRTVTDQEFHNIRYNVLNFKKIVNGV